jgi:ribosomal protein S18 acetylase RimI-like enzyme
MSTPVTVRGATPSEAALVAEVAAATFALACPPGMSPTRIAAFIDAVLSPERFEEYIADDSRVVLLAEAEDAVVGYAMLVSGEPVDDDVRAAITHRPTVELSKIYVLPQAHGGGVAGALMDACLERARALGAAAVWLGVNQQNARAQRFYAKCGFAVVGTKRFLVGDRHEDDYVMEQAIT